MKQDFADTYRPTDDEAAVPCSDLGRVRPCLTYDRALGVAMSTPYPNSSSNVKARYPGIAKIRLS